MFSSNFHKRPVKFTADPTLIPGTFSQDGSQMAERLGNWAIIQKVAGSILYR